MAAAARTLFNTNAGQAYVVLVVPFDPYPACEKVSDITDVWDHPLLHDKWRDVLVDVNLLTPVSRIIVSGAHAPIHVQPIWGHGVVCRGGGNVRGGALALTYS